MIVRPFDKDKDYADVAEWWAKQDWPVMPQDHLTTAGFIAENGDKKLAATWIFATNCPIYIMEWTVGNPEADWKERAEAIDLVTNTACEWAKQDGAKMVFTMAKHERYMDKLQKNGFNITESGMTHFIRSL